MQRAARVGAILGLGGALFGLSSRSSSSQAGSAAAGPAGPSRSAASVGSDVADQVEVGGAVALELGSGSTSTG